MALRTVCAAALRTGTDLGVNNARAFVTTGMESICIWQFLKILPERLEYRKYFGRLY